MKNLYTRTDVQEIEQIDLYHQATQPSIEEQEFINHHLMLVEIVDTIPALALSYHGTPTESDAVDILGMSSSDFDIIFEGDYDGENLNLAYSIIERYYDDEEELLEAVLEYYE